jgi:methylenetetrahydrofolate reductase (NADPH)
VEAGADYLVTQMFFDNKRYFRFVEKCRAAGITAPIVPGLKPLTALRQISFIPKTFNVDLPPAFANELVKCRTDQAVKEVGIEWCTAQARELKEGGAPCLHFYTMGRSEAVRAVVASVF